MAMRKAAGSRSVRRSGRERVIRLFLASLCLVFGYFSVTGALARSVLRANPSLSYALAPNLGAVVAANAEAQFVQRPDPQPGSFAAALANDALRLDMTAVKAVNTLALQAQLRNDTARARALFRYALLLSRREFRAQLWAIEDAVTRGDIREALRNYDNALRTSQAARDLLFPNLAAAIAEPKVRAGLLRVLATQPVWSKAFLDYIATARIDSNAALALYAESTRYRLPLSDDTRSGLVDSLVQEGKLSDAWVFYESFHPTANRLSSRDPDFTYRALTRAPFDWTLGDEEGVSATFTNEGNQGAVDFQVNPAQSGLIAQQMQSLKPGTYQFITRSRDIQQAPRSRPYWQIRCMGGETLAKFDLPNSDAQGQTMKGLFQVPESCPFQILSLTARSTAEIAVNTGQIKEARIVKSEGALP